MSEPLTVSVLGAGGFIGSRLVEWLILRDLAKVRPIVHTFRGMARLARFDLDCRVADALDQVNLKAHLKGSDVLFHCIVGGRDTILKSAETAYVAAASAGVRRLVYLSSAVVHGHDPAPGTDDDSPLVARQPFHYNISKVMAEQLLRRLRNDGAVEVVTLRPLIVFGPRSTWWTAQIATDLLRGKAYLIDGGVGICNTVYVDNLVQAMWQAAISNEARNEDFIITDGERITWRDLYSSVAEAVGIDIATVPCVESDALPRIFREQRRARLRTAANRIAWAIRESLPPGVISSTRKILPSRITKAIERQLKRPQAQGFEVLQAKVGMQSLPTVDRELSSLQRCRYMLPIENARKRLGYEPEVTFTEGCGRTREWLRFAFGLSRE